MSKVLLNATCPVCGTRCSENTKQCDLCGFADKPSIVPLWADAEDAQEWRETVLKPLRMEWELRELRKTSAKTLKHLENQEQTIAQLQHKLEQMWTILIGNTMKFGGYDWRVLDVQNGQALLLSDKVIESRRYHSNDVTTTWAKCELRGYLNGAFYNSFGQEKSRIIETPISNPSNLWYGTDGGSSTHDKVFLLSLEEVDKYFGNSGDYVNKRRKKYENGKYVAAAGGWAFSNENDNSRIATDASGKACWWWLRSPGNYGIAAAGVTDVGSVYVRGLRVSFASGGVRPALWLNL